MLFFFFSVWFGFRRCALVFHSLDAFVCFVLRLLFLNALISYQNAATFYFAMPEIVFAINQLQNTQNPSTVELFGFFDVLFCFVLEYRIELSEQEREQERDRAHFDVSEFFYP